MRTEGDDRARRIGEAVREVRQQRPDGSSRHDSERPRIGSAANVAQQAGSARPSVPNVGRKGAAESRRDENERRAVARLDETSQGGWPQYSLRRRLMRLPHWRLMRIAVSLLGATTQQRRQEQHKR